MKNFNIDWQQQWSLFAEGFTNGLAHLDLNQFGTDQILLLAPGAGFGDFSHPSTRLTLQLLSKLIKGKTFLDIGCGSGVLSLAAVMMGASFAYGIDIDDVAIAHAKENSVLNGLEKKVHFCRTNELPSITGPIIAAMNMISSEQQEAWKAHQFLSPQIEAIATSGVLVAEHFNYLSIASKWGWELIQEQEEAAWKAYLFKGNHS